MVSKILVDFDEVLLMRSLDDNPVPESKRRVLLPRTPGADLPEHAMKLWEDLEEELDYPLQALVSELLEPIHPTVVLSNAVHVYASRAHKGELVLGAGIDTYNSYGRHGAFHTIEHELAAATA